MPITALENASQLPQVLAEVQKAQTNYLGVAPGPSVRALSAPDPWSEVIRDRADRLPANAAATAVSSLACAMIYLAADRTPEMSPTAGKPATHHHVVESIVNGRLGNMNPGEMALWRIKTAGYKLAGALERSVDDFVAIEVEPRFSFRFVGGRLLPYGQQWRNAYLLGSTFGDQNTSYTYEQILTNLKNMAQGRSASEGYRWEVMRGTKESDTQDKILIMAFGEEVSNREQQRQVVNEQRASQLRAYHQASDDLLNRAGLPKPSKRITGSVHDILFHSPASVEAKGLVALAEVLCSAGVCIQPRQLVESLAGAYYATWNSGMNTDSSKIGRFR